MRKRKVDCNQPLKGKRASEPKNITPKQRVKEFPDQCLATMGAGAKLFCTTCREELTLKKNVIVSHVASAKHKSGKSRLAAREARERDITKLLQQGDVAHPIGETLPMDQRVYRVRVMECGMLPPCSHPTHKA